MLALNGRLNNAAFPVPKADQSSRLPIRIARFFRNKHLDLEADRASYSPSWPLDDVRTVVHNRLGTPQVGIVEKQSMVIPHDGLDIIRSSVSVSPDVHAPVSGLASVFYDWKEGWPKPGPDQVSVAIYDPVSHLISVMHHVHPTDELVRAGREGRMVEVKRGERVGEIVRQPNTPKQYQEKLRHTHFMVVDASGGRERLISAEQFFDAYKDEVAPTARDVYLMGDHGEGLRRLVDGRRDLLVTAFDRDDGSFRNFDLDGLGYKVVATTRNGERRVLKDVTRSNLNPFTEGINEVESTGAAVGLFDLNRAAQTQLLPTILDGRIDSDNPDRVFRYALTNLTEGPNGAAALLNDEDGYVDITPDIQSLEVTVEMSDLSGNTRAQTFTIRR